MPGRRTPLVTGEIYHIYNRGVAKLPTFTERTDYVRAVNLINYYRFVDPPLRYSVFIQLPPGDQEKIFAQLEKNNNILIRILTFKLMPNHFHFTLKQETDNGISKFIANFTNSYTKYVNTKKIRVGPLFQGTFKSVLVESIEQFIHLSRYHHLNAYTAGVVKSIEELLKFPYSSLTDYIETKVHDFVDTEIILSQFTNKAAYKKFVLAQADYQRRLGHIKKLLLEQPAKLVRNHLKGV